MLKRILSVLLCAALLLGGTALAAKEDDYTLPELLYQQFAVQDYPIRGSVAVTASGTASWLDFLLPLTALELPVRPVAGCDAACAPAESGGQRRFPVSGVFAG